MKPKRSSRYRSRNNKTKYKYCKTTHKKRFPDKQAAQIAVKHFSNNKASGKIKPTHQIPIRCYYCDHCNGYHLTSKPHRDKELQQQIQQPTTTIKPAC